MQNKTFLKPDKWLYRSLVCNSLPSPSSVVSFLQNANPHSTIPPHAKCSSTAPPLVQNASHHQSFSPTTQRLHLLWHHPSLALHLLVLPISHSQQFLPLSHPQFFSPTTLLTLGSLPPSFVGFYPYRIFIFIFGCEFEFMVSL